jgi:hypothetical protein
MRAVDRGGKPPLLTPGFGICQSLAYILGPTEISDYAMIDITASSGGCFKVVSPRQFLQKN